jgi:branched-chain amino acid transport system substrate-binding protein
MLANTAWGRSNREAAELHLAKTPGVTVVGTEWHNIGDESLLKQYTRLLDQGAEAILLVISDKEGASLIRSISALDAKLRVPLISHWGLTGGALVEMAGGDKLERLDFSVIQTFSLFRADPKRVRRVMEVARQINGVARPEEILSPVGFGHAYDLTHVLARAIDLAGSTDRTKVRDALEQVRNHDGLLRRFPRPFTPEHHEALQQSDVFFARYRADGALIPVASPSTKARR